MLISEQSRSKIGWCLMKSCIGFHHKYNCHPCCNYLNHKYKQLYCHILEFHVCNVLQRLLLVHTFLYTLRFFLQYLKWIQVKDVFYSCWCSLQSSMKRQTWSPALVGQVLDSPLSLASWHSPFSPAQTRQFNPVGSGSEVELVGSGAKIDKNYSTEYHLFQSKKDK